MKKIVYTTIVLLGVGALSAYTQNGNTKRAAANAAPKAAKISTYKNELNLATTTGKSDVATADGDANNAF